MELDNDPAVPGGDNTPPAGNDGQGANNNGFDVGGGADNPPAAGQTPPSAGNGGAGNSAPDQGVTLNGKDDTGAGEGGDQGQGEKKQDGQNGAEGGGDSADEYAITYPEGFNSVPSVEAAIRDYVKTKSLPPDQAKAEAQRLADIQVKAVQDMNAELVQKLDATKQQWRQEIEADPQYGGANLKRTREDANVGLRHYAPKLIPLLAEWNLERQPDLVRHFADLGRNMRENRSPKPERPGQHHKKTLVDSKEEMLAREEAKAKSL